MLFRSADDDERPEGALRKYALFVPVILDPNTGVHECFASYLLKVMRRDAAVQRDG